MLTGYRLLPRTNVVAAQWYFIWDILAAAMAYYIHQVEGFFPILIIQQVQHIFYLTTWDQSWAAKRVISWSSLEWDRGRWNQVDLVLGTAFDMGVHMANTWVTTFIKQSSSLFISDISLVQCSVIPAL